MSAQAPSVYSRTGAPGHENKPIWYGDKLVETYGKGRVCARQGCGTVLNVYNPEAYCDLHSDDQYTSLQHECTEEGLWVCPECGREILPHLRYWRTDPRCKDGLAAVCKKCERTKRKD